MKPQIKFFLADETLKYFIKKSFGKVVHQNDQKVFIFEVESTDDLDHVEGDSLQNEFPEIILSIEDFPIDCNTIEELLNQKLDIPNSVELVENEDGENYEVYYTNLNLNDEDDLATNENKIDFHTDAENDLCINWKGVCEHFKNPDEKIPFEVVSKLNFKNESPQFYE